VRNVSYISINSTNFHNPNFTYSSWVNLSSYATEASEIISDYSGNYKGNVFDITSSGHVRIIVMSSSSASYDCIGSSIIQLNNWVYLSASYDGQKLRLYLNCNLTDSSQANFYSYSTAGSLLIGSASWCIGCSQLNFHGKIDDIRIYSCALSNSEIQALYQENGWDGVPDNNISDIVIFPNPSIDKVYINSVNPVKIQVYNLLGKLIITTDNSKFNYVELSGKGIYLFELTTSKKTIYKKIIIQ